MFDRYCRLCAEKKPFLIDFTSSAIRNELLEKLLILNINLDVFNKNLPETVCRSCHSKVNEFYEFSTKVKNSQVVLSNIFSNEFKIESGCYYSSHFEEDDVKLEDCLEKSKDTEYTTHQPIETKNQAASWSSYPWLCHYCKLTFHSIEALREHSKEHHNTCCAWLCADCMENFYEFDGFVKHVRKHREWLSYFCEYCDLKLENNDIHSHLTQFNCKYCRETFENEDSLQFHLKHYQNGRENQSTKHEMSDINSLLFSFGMEGDKISIGSWKEYFWICMYCHMKFSNQDIFRNHAKEVHSKCFGIKCVDCDINLDNFEDFINHARMHRESLRYFCQYCDMKLSDRHDDIVHINEHIRDRIQCESCGQLFQNKIDLQGHIAKYNPSKTRKRKFYNKEECIIGQDLTCESCGKLTKSLKSLRAHRLLHTNRNRDYTCDRCGKTFFTKGALSAHNILHENPEPQICKICKKSFLTLTRLKKHVKSHYGEKPFQCNVCHRRFRLKEHLKSHELTHTDIMPHSCQYCGKVFRYRNVLKVHENQHTGARPYSCGVCNMDFANWSNCNKHLKRKHGTTLAKNMMTPQGKLPINPKTGEPKKVKDLETVKEWSQMIMAPLKRAKKSSKLNDFN